MGGEFDAFQRGTPMLYQRLSANGTPVQFVDGPWSHIIAAIPAAGVSLPGMANEPPGVRLGELQLRWFDHYVRGVPDPALERRDKQVTYFENGANQWRTAGQWPQADVTYQKSFLSGQASRGRPGTLVSDTAQPSNGRQSPDGPQPSGAAQPPKSAQRSGGALGFGGGQASGGLQRHGGAHPSGTAQPSHQAGGMQPSGSAQRSGDVQPSGGLGWSRGVGRSGGVLVSGMPDVVPWNLFSGVCSRSTFQWLLFGGEFGNGPLRIPVSPTTGTTKGWG
ncbi:hydrolase CocE/NonD family protein [Actinomadura rudentiformis]|uniref:hypothetical protein n=1 Tax=Actinomadura rudentiformis TaxID=359158 RepID=UPI00178C3986|nr:hypothetical protein [Actinomadura rudentiformis]